MARHTHTLTTARYSGEVPVSPDAQRWQTLVEQALEKAGFRSTGPRRAMLSWIAARYTPFSAETLVDEMTERQRVSSRPTVYRLLEWLRSEGWLARVRTDESQNAYARILPGHYHHAVCTSCGATLVIPGCSVEAALTPKLNEQGFEMHGHLLEVYGLCTQCRNAKTSHA